MIRLKIENDLDYTVLLGAVELAEKSELAGAIKTTIINGLSVDMFDTKMNRLIHLDAIGKKRISKDRLIYFFDSMVIDYDFVSMTATIHEQKSNVLILSKLSKVKKLKQNAKTISL